MTDFHQAAMKKFTLRAAVFALLLLGVLILLVSTLQRRTTLSAGTGGPYHFTFCSITSGTNHTLFSGNQLLALLNGGLVDNGFQPVTSDREYRLRSSQDGTLLSVGYLFDGDRTNPALSMRESQLLGAILVESNGTEIPFKKFVRSTVAGRPGEHLSQWLIPEAITNFIGCKLRFIENTTGQDVATLVF